MSATRTLDDESEIDPLWQAVEATHGGYAMGVALSRMESPPGQVPVAVTGHFFGSVRPGPCRFATRSEHLGSTTATGSVTLVQSHPRLHVLAKFSTRAQAINLVRGHDLSTVASPEEAAPGLSAPYGPMPYMDVLDLVQVSVDEVAGSRQTSAWVRVADHPTTAHLGGAGVAAVLIDSVPPGAYYVDRGGARPRNVPTMELTLHLGPQGARTGEWYFVTQQVDLLADDFCIESAVAHDRDGVPIAFARQSRRIVTAPPEGK